MGVSIVKAQPSDIDEIEALYDCVCDFLHGKEYNPGWKKGAYPARREALHFLEGDALYVAKSDGQIVGSVALTHNPDEETERADPWFVEAEYADVLFIHVLVVHPDHMREGIGTAMLLFAEQFAAQQGIRAMRLYVYEKNAVAIRAYEKSGYVYVEKVDIGLRQYGLDWFCLYEKPIAP